MKPRFVAGAVCPQCQAVDRIVIETLEGEKHRRCVACGFSERSDGDAQPGPVKGRLERPRRGSEAVHTVKILGPEPDEGECS